jgi:hypothetical protein
MAPSILKGDVWEALDRGLVEVVFVFAELQTEVVLARECGGKR